MSEEIKIFISGDFAPTERVAQLITSGEYAKIYNDILPVIQDADISITNLELPLVENGTPIAKTGPNIKASPKSIEALTFAGFNMVTLANNHIMDYGSKGLFSTMQLCKDNGIDYIGVGKNLKEASKVKYIDCKDQKIAFINLAENEWSTTHGSEPGANPLNEINQYYQIIEAKENADYVILIVHGGHETYGLPSPRMKKLYRYFVDLGVDAVVGHHTHCYSGHEVFKGKPIFYSLGNFIFDRIKYSNSSDWNIGCAVTLNIIDNKIDFELHPYYQCNQTVGITLFTDNEKSAFIVDAERKTAIIQNDKELDLHFNDFVLRQERMYFSYLEPLKNKYLLAAMNRSLLPRLIGKRQRRLLLNLIKAEAHKDILVRLLSDKE